MVALLRVAGKKIELFYVTRWVRREWVFLSEHFTRLQFEVRIGDAVDDELEKYVLELSVLKHYEPNRLEFDEHCIDKLRWLIRRRKGKA